jgi:hypothetical protein
VALAEGAPARRAALIAGGIFLGTLLLFAPVLRHEWLNYDDDVYITSSPEVRSGLSPRGVAWAFTSFHGANWFPLTRLSWMLDVELFGEDPAGFHATGALLHAAASAVLFAAFWRMTGDPWRSAVVAGVFAWHPLHVESVAWAAARKDPLSGLFFALCLLAWSTAGVRPPSRRRIGIVFALLALGLMSKPTLVTLPFVLLLLDDWPLRRLRRGGDPTRFDPAALRRALVEKLPLFALVAVACVVVFAAQHAGGTVVELERLPLGVRAANAVAACASYLGRAVWPSELAVFYPHPGATLPTSRVVASAALVAALTIGALAVARRRPWFPVGWLWYLGTLVPVLGLVQVGAQAMADRYTYLPLIGLAVALAWGVPELAGPRLRRAVGFAAAAWLAGLAAQSAVQLGHWRDSESLFRHALAVTERNHVAHAHLGAALLERGDAAGAVEQWSEALRIRPDFLRVANNLAWLAATDPRVRDPQLAVGAGEAAARLADDEAGAVLDTLAAAYAAAGRFDDAVRTAERALSLAEAGGDAGLAAEVRERLASYRAGRPWTAPP